MTGFILPALIIGGLLLLGMIFYFASLASRRRYTCPKCGERTETEHLAAKRCGMCGAPLERNEKP